MRDPDAASFAKIFKTGERPGGQAIKVMPFGSLREMNDTDVHALHLCLKSLGPAAPRLRQRKSSGDLPRAGASRHAL